jgi:hypothetical protein
MSWDNIFTQFKVNRSSKTVLHTEIWSNIYQKNAVGNHKNAQDREGKVATEVRNKTN